MTRTIRSFCALGAVLLLSAGLTAQTLGDFRSKVTGDWNSLGTWFYWNGSGWVDAFATPTDLSGVITIMPGHVVTVIDNRSADQLIVSSGGTLTLSSGTLTVPDGAGIDLDVNGSLNLSGGSISTTGALRLNGGPLNWNAGTIGGGGSLTIASGTVTQNTPWTNTSIALVVDFGTWNTTLGNGTTIAPGGTLTWNSGTIAGPGGFTVDAGATATLATGNNKTLNSTLTNSGTINWGAGTWIGSGSVQNATGGVFNINFDSFGQLLQVPVVNSGAVNHTSSGTSLLPPPSPTAAAVAST
jgi:adhesin HecA-like repeat protein